MSVMDSIQIPDFCGKGAGKEFENIVLERLDREHKEGNGSFGRYGVQMTWRKREHGDGVEAQPIRSLPDIEGALHTTGRQVIFDCKVCSQASFGMADYRDGKSKKRQLNHMLDRAQFGAICGFLIHWNSRELKTKSEPVETHWLPVDPRLRLWREFVACEVTNVTREQCRTYGHAVEWNLDGRESKFRPDVMTVLLMIAGQERRPIPANPFF